MFRQEKSISTQKGKNSTIRHGFVSPSPPLSLPSPLPYLPPPQPPYLPFPSISIHCCSTFDILRARPGLHVLDVSEVSFKHLPGWEEAVAARAAVREELLTREVPIFLSTEKRLYEEPGRAQQRAGRTPQPHEDPPVRVLPPVENL